jgi:hypothetical protein
MAEYHYIRWEGMSLLNSRNQMLASTVFGMEDIPSHKS